MKRFRNWLLEAVKGPHVGVLIASVWLVCLVFPVHSLLVLEDRVRCLVGLLALVLFVPVYLAGFRDLGSRLDAAGRRWQLLRGGFVLAVMCVLCWAIGLDAISLLPFLVTFASYGLWPPVRLPAVVVLVGSGFLMPVLMNEPDADNNAIMFITALVAVLGLLTVKTIESGIVISEQNRRRAALEQRERMARDVHDLLGHSLTVITLKADLARKLLHADPDRADAELEAIAQLSRSSLAEVRSTVTRLRIPDFSGEIQASERALQTASVTAKLPDAERALSAVGVNSSLFSWVLREAVTNIVRHSQAGFCEVRVSNTGLEILDNGVGVPAEYAAGSGIKGMKSRVESAGGTLIIEDAPARWLRAHPAASGAADVRGTRLRVSMDGNTAEIEPSGETDD